MAEHAKKNQNLFVLTFIPNKNDNTAAKIRKIIVIISLLVFIGCGIYILNYFGAAKADKEMNDELSDMIHQAEGSGGTLNLLKEEINEKIEEPPVILDKFTDLYAENKDLVGWIKAGHYIDYPVLMREGLENTDYYLYRNFYEEDSISGSIFCDNHVLPLTDANNLVIYGHNMQSGEYFASLTYYYPYSSHYSDGYSYDNQAFIDYYLK